MINDRNELRGMIKKKKKNEMVIKKKKKKDKGEIRITFYEMNER
jgi:hypothetical protein